MSASTHQVAIKGVDQTGAAFKSISARAKATGASIRSIMGGAIAAAGAYLSFRSIKGGIDELGKLSDLAMKSGTSVDALTKSALAFQVAGLNLPVESLAKSFQYLKKQTGEGGIDNFYKVAQSIAAIKDPAQRGAELVKTLDGPDLNCSRSSTAAKTRSRRCARSPTSCRASRRLRQMREMPRLTR